MGYECFDGDLGCWLGFALKCSGMFTSVFEAEFSGRIFDEEHRQNMVALIFLSTVRVCSQACLI